MVTKTDDNAVDSSTTENDEIVESSTTNDENGKSSLPESTGSREVNEEAEENRENARFDKHPRFQELRNKAKEYESRVKELEAELSAKSTQPEPRVEEPKAKEEIKPATTEEKKDFIDEYVQRYVSMGYEPKFAKDMAKVQWDMARAAAGQEIQPIQSHFASQKVEKIYQEFGKTKPEIYKDGNILPEVEKKMEETFKTLPPDMKASISKSGVEGLNYLYWKAYGTAPVPAVKTEKIEVNKKLGSTLGKTSTPMSKVTEDKSVGKKISSMTDEEYETYRTTMGLGTEG